MILTPTERSPCRAPVSTPRTARGDGARRPARASAARARPVRGRPTAGAHVVRACPAGAARGSRGGRLARRKRDVGPALAVWATSFVGWFARALFTQQIVTAGRRGSDTRGRHPGWCPACSGFFGRALPRRSVDPPTGDSSACSRTIGRQSASAIQRSPQRDPRSHAVTEMVRPAVSTAWPLSSVTVSWSSRRVRLPSARRRASRSSVALE